MGKAIIFDGNSILNRAFYGVRPLSAPDGLPTNALFGFVGIIKKSIAQIGGNPDFAAIAFDLPHKTFRHLACDTYKANRKGMPDELAVQLPFAKELANALGLTVLECKGFEADDVLGTLSKEFCEENHACYIVTGDRDSFQLVNKCVTVLLASNDDTKVVTPEFIFEKYGLPPKKLVDVKAIMGDSSDNIKGVAGIGEKGAVALIKEYGTLEGVYEHIEETKGATRTKLEAGKDSAFESRFLAEIRTDAPLQKKAVECGYEGERFGELKELYTRLGFRQFLEKMEKDAPKAEETEFVAVTEEHLKSIDSSTDLFLDLENKTLYCRYGDVCVAATGEDIFKLLKKGNKLICWSAKEIITLADGLGIGNSVRQRFEDISLMAYVLSPADNGVSFGKVALDRLAVTSKEPRADLLPQLLHSINADMTEEAENLYRNIERPLCAVLSSMEQRGVGVDADALKVFSERLSRELSEEEQAIYQLAGGEFNINSPKQLGTVLFEKLRLPHFKKTKSGYSTDAEVLAKLEPYHPIVGLILDYRRDAKLKSTYCDGLSKQIAPDGRIHTTFKQTMTMTGRLSSAEPNLQNIPVRSSKGRELRRFFAAKEGCVLIDADYSQIELRVLAHISGDKALREAFLSGADVHSVTASQIFGVPLQSVTHEMRSRAKTINFGIIYGMGDYTLSQDLRVSRKAAGEYIDSYFRQFPDVKSYMEDTKKQAYADGYVTTMFGRRRYIPELAAKNANLRAFGERVAMNTPIQGSAADIIKIAMIKTEEMLDRAGIDAHLVLQIHDELMVETSREHLEAAQKILFDAMTQAAETAVPLTVDVGVGKSWYDAKQD